MKCKDCKWAFRIKTYIYNCIYIGMTWADKDACEKFKEKD
jgi:hypothetical protein